MRNVLYTALLAGALVISSPASATGILNFIIDGNTFTQSFRITNSSTAGESVVGFGFDLSPTVYIFDTVNGGVPGNGTDGVAFTPTGGTGVSTGLVGPVTVADGAKFFGINFTNFTPGKFFEFDIDVDGDAAHNSLITVTGGDLIGATAYVDFSNGLRSFGTLAAIPGNSDASSFTVTSTAPTPAVPEPATWAMFIGGFGLVGVVTRRRKVAFSCG